MMQIALIGISAGAAAALLFASVMSGLLFSIFLFHLAPLPLMIAGLGWTHWAALTATLFAFAALGLVFSISSAAAFLVGVGLAAWWLTYLALLARPVAAADNTGKPELEWYPLGRLVIWSAALAALAVVVAILAFGTDAETFRRNFGGALSSLMRIDAANPSLRFPGGVTPQEMVDFMVAIFPPAAAVTLTLTKLVNVWLAGRIVSVSGRLPRPWPQISAIAFPPQIAAAFAAATALSFVDAMVGIVATVCSASLGFAYALLGFAVLHDITRGMNGRAFVLASAYLSVPLLQGWPMLVLCVVGLVESTLGLRARVARRRGPPVFPNPPQQ